MDIYRLAADDMRLKLLNFGDPKLRMDEERWHNRGACTAHRSKKLYRCLCRTHKFAGGQDACAVGPGLGRSAELATLVTELVAQVPRPLVIDADGLNDGQDLAGFHESRNGMLNCAQLKRLASEIGEVLRHSWR